MEREIVREIQELKKKNNAIILAHNYQRPEVQDIADFVGDTLSLSRKTVNTDAKVIVFCGVDFMAETAAILNPGKKVLIPDLTARCPMAHMLSLDKLLDAKKNNTGADVVLYINTTAEVKAHADCICTSANSPQIVNSMDSDTVLFGPDRNLMYYIQKRTQKKLVCVPDDGLCPTHHQISEWEIIEAKEKYPYAEVVVHPETIPEVQDMADAIASTEGIINYCKNAKAREFIIGTEIGIIHRLEREIKNKKFYPASKTAVCPNMKIITLEKIKTTLQDMKHEVRVPEETASKARVAINRMLKLS